MDKILFSKRLKERRKTCGYSSSKAFASAYNARFIYGGTDLAGNNPDAGILGTIKNYENPNHQGMPRLDIVANICSLIDCDIDYLLGYIDYPKHIHQAMNDECGLSQKATERLMSWHRMFNYSKTLNIILESANFESALFHAVHLMKIVPTLEGLRRVRRKWQQDTFSGPPDCGTAYNYTGDNGLADAISEKEKEYASQRLYLDDNFRFLIQELERVSLEKAEQNQTNKE